MGYNIPSKTIDELTYMDDVFLSTALEDNIPVVQRMVRIILDDESIVVTKETSQKELKNLFGRSIRCDAYSEDDKSRKYDIEIQNGSEGASVIRARYNSAMLDTNNDLSSDLVSKQLTDSFVIFITDHDHFELGWSVYHVERCLLQNHDKNQAVKNVKDGSHIIYVNGLYNDISTPIGRLIADMKCKNPEDMYYDELRERTYYLKRTEEGRKHMSTAMTTYVEYSNSVARAEVLVKAVENAADGLNASIEDACKILKISVNDYYSAKKLAKEAAEMTV